MLSFPNIVKWLHCRVFERIQGCLIWWRCRWYARARGGGVNSCRCMPVVVRPCIDPRIPTIMSEWSTSGFQPPGGHLLAFAKRRSAAREFGESHREIGCTLPNKTRVGRHFLHMDNDTVEIVERDNDSLVAGRVIPFWNHTYVLETTYLELDIMQWKKLNPHIDHDL